MRNTDTSAATAANRLRKQKRWAAEMRSDGWLVQEYPMDPQHYGDYCAACVGPAPTASRKNLICKPHALVSQDGRALEWAYECPVGHTWTCFYRASDGYFSNCMCAWCAYGRVRDEVKTWPRTPFYNAGQS